MSRPVRIPSALAALTAGLLLAGVGTTASTAEAATAAPSITAVGSGAGPRQATVVVLTGKNLTGADAVVFGATGGSIVGRAGAAAVKVRTPRTMSAGTVAVRIHTRAGWSKPSATARYTFVDAPELTRLSPATGPFTGGQRVTLTGTHLARTTSVTFGTARAAVVSASAGSVVVTAPVGVLGPAKVVLTASGGSTRSLDYTYAAPLAQASTTLAPVARTVEPAAVDWVTGGPDGVAGASTPWLVGLPAHATVPAVGAPFLVRPGATAFSSGLAGTVAAVAVQADDSVRVTVKPAPVATSFDRLTVDYSGTPAASAATVRQKDAETAVQFPIDGSALFCHDQQGRSVAFGAEFTMTVTDVDVTQHLDLGGPISRPTYDGALTTEVRTVGKFHGEVASTCKIKADWADAHRHVFPLGTSGATVSIGPAFEFSVSAKGTLTVVDRTRTTYAVSAALGRTPTFSRTSRSVESTIGGALSFEAGVAAGISVQFGLLDRAGIDTTVMLGLSVGLEASTENVCVTGKLALKLAVSLFLDAWVDRWESPALTASIDLKQWARACVLPEPSPPTTGEPQIASVRLPDAPIGQAYTAALATVDQRPGSWTVVQAALPAGLRLDAATGAVSGTPTGPVGDQALIVDFRDADGRFATTTIRVRVQPSTGIGGGDVQVTLRWSGPADLDLHVTDPTDEEIYFHHRTSASGGSLDHDANAGCNGTEDDDNPVENVFWPAAAAPAGRYSAWVKVYAACGGALDWHLTVRRNGVVVVVDETGTGDSSAYVFPLGTATGTAVSTHVVPTRSYPIKGQGREG